MKTSQVEETKSLQTNRSLGGVGLVALSIAFGVPLILSSNAYGLPQATESSEKLPRFEVASVRIVSPNEVGVFSISPPGATTFSLRNARLSLLIALAFGIDSSSQISGKPNWLESEHYDIVAKPEGDVGLTYEELRPFLQQLLQERFHLTYHHDAKMRQGYALVLAKGGPKLIPSSGDTPKALALKDGLRIHTGTIQLLASMLSHPVGAPVIDKTGITGNYDIQLNFADDEASESPLPSVFTAVQEVLGLKLVKQEVPFDVLMIDHVDRIPTDN
jgi:uncharacterized protein (TIGR03435 family)